MSQKTFFQLHLFRLTNFRGSFLFARILFILSTFGVFVGVFSSVLVQSIFTGFQSVSKEFLVATFPHVEIRGRKEELFRIQKETLSKQSSQIVATSLGQEQLSVFLANDNMVSGTLFSCQSPYLKEIFKSETTQFFGSIPSSATNDIIIPIGIATRLGVRLGEFVSLASTSELGSTFLQGSLPSSTQVRVAGIFATNNKMVDESMCFNCIGTSFQSGSKLPAVLLFRLISKELATTFIQDTRRSKPSTLSWLSWEDFNSSYLAVYKFEYIATIAVLSVITLVSLFTLSVSLYILLQQNRKSIAILQVLGAHRNTIQRIYFSFAYLASLGGIILGLITALLVVYAQKRFNFIPFDTTNLLVNTLPIEVNWWSVGLTIISFTACSFFASFAPLGSISVNSSTDIRLVDS